MKEYVINIDVYEDGWARSFVGERKEAMSCKHEWYQVTLTETFGVPSWQCGCGHYFSREEIQKRQMRTPDDAQKERENQKRKRYWP